VKVDEINTFFNSSVTRKFVYNYIIFYQKILVGDIVSLLFQKLVGRVCPAPLELGPSFDQSPLYFSK